LPDGFSLALGDAKARGFDVVPWPDGEKTASKHPHDKQSVVLARGVVVAAETARDSGFKIGERISRDPRSSWRSSIITSPEAKDRPEATAELVLSQSEATISVDAARAFLRGLPVESEHTDTTEGTMTTDTDPKAARLAEIKGSMAVFNASQGRHSGTVKIADGVTFSATRGYSTQPMQGEVDPAKVRRLAEIRYSTMMGNGKAHTTEAKKLKLALDTNATMGTAIDVALAQVGFDVKTLFVTR
jgi:hypothetical protein